MEKRVDHVEFFSYSPCRSLGCYLSLSACYDCCLKMCLVVGHKMVRIFMRIYLHLLTTTATTAATMTTATTTIGVDGRKEKKRSENEKFANIYKTCSYFALKIKFALSHTFGGARARARDRNEPYNNP